MVVRVHGRGAASVTPQFGAGITLTGTAHRGPATVSATIPHPGFFNARATGVDETSDDLERTEGAIHVQGVFVVPTSDRLQLRFFGGPWYFQVTQDTVDDIRFRQTFGTVANANSVTITDVGNQHGPSRHRGRGAVPVRADRRPCRDGRVAWSYSKL